MSDADHVSLKSLQQLGTLLVRFQQVVEPLRVVQDEFRGVELVTGVLDPDERFRVIEPAAGLDQAGDVLDVRLLRVVAPPRRVVLLRRQQLGSNPFRAVAPGAVVAGVVIDGADVPLLDHVAAAGVVRHLVFQQAIVPNVSSGKKRFTLA